MPKNQGGLCIVNSSRSVVSTPLIRTLHDPVSSTSSSIHANTLIELISSKKFHLLLCKYFYTEHIVGSTQ